MAQLFAAIEMEITEQKLHHRVVADRLYLFPYCRLGMVLPVHHS